MRETDLVKPVADWLRAHGLTVYAEVGRGPIDLVGLGRCDRIVCVELKTSLTRHVLRQAVLRHSITSEVYVAVGTIPRKASLALARQYRVGVLTVQDNTAMLLLGWRDTQAVCSHARTELIACLRESAFPQSYSPTQMIYGDREEQYPEWAKTR